MFAGENNKPRNIKERYGKEDTDKLIERFPELLEMVNEKDFDLFKDSKYEVLNRYLKSSINYINKKFWVK